jgi:hypothetical protein
MSRPMRGAGEAGARGGERRRENTDAESDADPHVGEEEERHRRLQAALGALAGRRKHRPCSASDKAAILSFLAGHGGNKRATVRFVRAIVGYETVTRAMLRRSRRGRRTASEAKSTPSTRSSRRPCSPT